MSERKYSKRIQKDLGLEEETENFRAQNYRERHIRAVALIGVFLICMPIIFSVVSLGRIDTPDFEFALVSQSDRIDASGTDFSSLNYHSNLENLEFLSINNKFVVRSQVSASFGQAANIRVRLVPENLEYVEGYVAYYP